jgi:hypothetical protein
METRGQSESGQTQKVVANSGKDKAADSSASDDDGSEDSSSDDDESNGYVRYEMEPLAKANSLRNLASRAGDKTPTASAVQTPKSPKPAASMSLAPQQGQQSFEPRAEPQTVQKVPMRPVLRSQATNDAEDPKARIDPDQAPVTATVPITPVRRIPPSAFRTSSVQDNSAVPTGSNRTQAGPIMKPPSPAVESTSSHSVRTDQQLSNSLPRPRQSTLSSEDASTTSASETASPTSPKNFTVSAPLLTTNGNDAVSDLFMKLEKKYVTPPLNSQRPVSDGRDSKQYPVEVC